MTNLPEGPGRTNYLVCLVACGAADPQTHAIYRSASDGIDENGILENIATRLHHVSDNVSTEKIPVSSPVGSERENRTRREARDLVAAANDCKSSAAILLKALASLKVQNKTIWSSFKAALKDAMKKSEIEQLSKRIMQLQLHLNLHIQTAMMYAYNICYSFVFVFPWLPTLQLTQICRQVSTVRAWGIII